MNEYRQGIERYLEPIALEFFACFSRFEFALKRGGYVQGRVGGKASPHWIKFADDLGDAFFQDIRACEPAGIFFAAPPKRLTVAAAGTVTFTDEPAVVNTQMLLASVGLVRNNLFHGEKPFIGQRDVHLLTGGLFVLDSAFATAFGRQDMQTFCEAFRYAPINGH